MPEHGPDTEYPGKVFLDCCECLLGSIGKADEFHFFFLNGPRLEKIAEVDGAPQYFEP